MNKKAFTLIELLAVIVILAIIALIAVPIIINIIRDTKEKSREISKDLYLNAVEQTILKENIEGSLNPSTCRVTIDGNIVCDDKEIKIEVNGEKPCTGDIKLNKGMVVEETIKYCEEPKSFKDDDWPTIAFNVKKGNIGKYKVGDTKQVDLGELGVHTLRIANKTTPSECKKEGFSQTACGFVIEFVDIINDQPMNTTNTNVGGWNASSLREYLNDTIYKALTKEIGDIIIDTYVVSGHGLDDNNNQNFTCTDKLYLLSVHEIYEDGSSDKVSTYDTAWNNTRQLDYYIGVTTDDTSGAIKNALWLLRTATSNRTNTFFHGGSYGHWDMRYADAPCGVSPAFRIG